MLHTISAQTRATRPHQRGPVVTTAFRRKHPLDAVQRAAGNRSVHRLVHALVPQLQRQPAETTDDEKAERDAADKARVNACLQEKHTLLPRVGLVAHIHRESVLTEMLGSGRTGFEQQVRASWDARKFVCQAGLSAMMALFFTRDYHNRLWVERAVESLARHPHWYSVDGIDRLKRRKDFLVQTFGIKLEPGDKDWSPEDISLLWQALSRLDDREIPVIRGYRFIRWTTMCNQVKKADPTAECTLELEHAACGLHVRDVIGPIYSITMYDCYKSESGDQSDGFNVKRGADTILHEVGHAMSFGRMKVPIERERAAKREYERLKKQAAAATGSAKSDVMTRLAEARQELDEATAAVRATSPAFPEFERLIKGQRPLTPYSARNSDEAFAEAYMLYKVAPQKLRKANRKLFDWFDAGKHL